MACIYVERATDRKGAAEARRELTRGRQWHWTVVSSLRFFKMDVHLRWMSHFLFFCEVFNISYYANLWCCAQPMDWVFQEKLISLFLLPLQNGFKHLFTEQEIQVYWKLLTVSRTFWVTKMREFTPILLRCFCHSCPCMTARLELEKWDVRGRCQSVWLLKHRGMSSGLCNGEHEIQSDLDIVWSMSGFVDRNSTKRYGLSNMDRQEKLFFCCCFF